MKKLYYIVIGIGALIFLNWIISTLPSFSNKVFTVAKESMVSSTFSSTSSSGFKSTGERSDLLKEMIKINNKFIKEPPISFPEQKNNIKYFYKLESLFPDFKSYYIAKLKVNNIIFNELPILLQNTSSLNEDDLQKYFNNNTKYLEEKWGINNFNDFNELVLTIKQLNNKEILSYELEDSYFYMPNQGTTNFRIILTPKDSELIYIAATAEIYNNTDYQTAPVLRFFGTILGGVS